MSQKVNRILKTLASFLLIVVAVFGVVSLLDTQILTGPQGAHHPITSHNYIVFTNSTGYYAENGLTGQIDYSSSIANNVINNASALGPTYIMAGWYNTDAAIVAHSNFPLVGAGANLTFINQIAGVVADGIQAINQNNVVIQNLTVILNTARTGRAGYPDELLQCDISIQNCSGVLVQGTNDYNSGWDGLQVFGSASYKGGGSCSNVTIQDNNIFNSTWHCIQFWNGVSHSQILDNNITGSGLGSNQGGITLEGATYDNISGNIVQKTQFGVDMGSYNYGVVTNDIITQNYLYNNNQAGIYIRDASNLTISENYINQPTNNGPGIYQTGLNSVDVKIENNSINVLGNGFYSNGGVDGYMISGNTITGYYAPDKDCIYIGATATGGNQTAQITNNYLYNNYYSFVLSETKNVLVSQNTAEGIWTGGDVADSGTNTQFVLNFFDGKFYATGHP